MFHDILHPQCISMLFTHTIYVQQGSFFSIVVFKYNLHGYKFPPLAIPLSARGSEAQTFYIQRNPQHWQPE